MSNDTEIRSLLERSAAAPRRQAPMSDLRRRARRSRITRASAVLAGAGFLVVGASGLLTTANTDGPSIIPATVPPDMTSPSQTDPYPSPSQGDDEPSPRNLEWPDAFVPATVPSAERRVMPVILPDRTAFNLSYPAELRLADLGVQVTLSYSFEEGRRNQPHDIIFVHGPAPAGLLDPDPLETFDVAPIPAALHSVAYDYLRGDPPYALVYETEKWTIIATVPERKDAESVARHLHPSVTSDGWPTVLADGPLQLSEFFGEARGPHLEIHDENPLWDVADSGEEFRYVVMGPSNCNPARDGAELSGGNWYGSRCLEFAGGGRAIFVSVYGPEEFVRAIVEGIALES